MIRVLKDKVERYKFKAKNWWAVFFLSIDGYLDIQSDYGDYSYRWGSFGPCFKQFLIDCDRSYLLGKLGMNKPKEFDNKKTYECIKRDIINMRREGEINSEIAKESWEQAKYILEFMNEHEYQEFIIGSNNIIYGSIYKDTIEIPCIMEYSYQLRYFLDECWKEFIKILKEEVFQVEKSEEIYSSDKIEV